jgi:hypothetical protein
MTEYTPPTLEEATDSIRRAAAYGDDYIFIDNRRQRWLWDAAELGVQAGLLQNPEQVDFEQSTEIRYRFTEKGRALAK